MKMYDNILKKARRYEEKRGIDYAKIDGSLYKRVKVFYILILLYTLFMNFSYIMGMLLTESKFKVLKDTVYIVAIFSVLMIAALVIIHFKRFLWVHITAFVLNLASAIVMILTFARLLPNDIGGYLFKFYWRHSIPLGLIALLSLWLTVIAVRAILRTNKVYKKIVQDICDQHKKDADGETLSQEELDEILKNA